MTRNSIILVLSLLAAVSVHSQEVFPLKDAEWIDVLTSEAKYPTGSGGYGQIAVVQNGNLIVFNENYRDLIDELYSSVDKITNGAKVKVFQNQADKEITVTSSSDPLKYVGLYSTSGVLINEKFCDRQLETVISARSFGKGVYLVKIVLQSGTSETHKIIVK
jgi:hypothetical protein